MKTTLTFAIVAALTGSAFAQTAKPETPAPTPAPAPASGAAAKPEEAGKEKTTIQLVYVPTETMKANAPSGKLKENTFYWTNNTDNSELGPKAITEEGNTFLRVQGTYPDFSTTGDVTKARTESITCIYRAFNIPAGTKKATLTYTSRVTHNVWKDAARSIGMTLAGDLLLTKDGLFLTSVCRPGTPNEGWKTNTAVVTVPPETQQAVVRFKTDGGVAIDIQAMSIAFE